MDWIGLDPELEILDLTDKDFWTDLDKIKLTLRQNLDYTELNPGPETGFNARKFEFKARTKYGVYKRMCGGLAQMVVVGA